MPAYTPVPTYSRHLKPATGEDGFFAQTLSSTITIPSVHTFRNSSLSPIPSQPPPWPSPIYPPQLIPVDSDSDSDAHSDSDLENANADLLMVLQLAAPGVCGHPGTAHGGALATVIDEAMSLGVTLYAPEAAEDYQSGATGTSQVPQGQGQGGRIRSKMFTSQLDVRYKRPVSVPGEIEVRVKVLAKQGKKVWVKAQVVQKGEVMVDAMAFWLLTGVKSVL